MTMILIDTGRKLLFVRISILFLYNLEVVMWLGRFDLKENRSVFKRKISEELFKYVLLEILFYPFSNRVQFSLMINSSVKLRRKLKQNNTTRYYNVTG